MTAFSEIVTTGAGHAMRVFCMLLMFIQIYVAVEAFRMKRGALFRILTVLQAAGGLVFFSLLLDGTFRETYLPFTRTYPALTDLIYSAPWPATALILCAFAFLCAGSLLSLRLYKRTHVSNDAIKRTVDLLPEGICFGDGDGTAVFFNVKMEEWCRALTGGQLKSAKLLRSRVEELGEPRGDNSIVLTPDGTALMFGFCDIEIGGRNYTQITALDISEQYRITAELREHNADLIGIRERMKEFSGRAAEFAMSEELLKARVTAHDEIGHVLLRIKYYLDNPDTTDEANLVAFVRTMNDLLLSDFGQAAQDREDAASAVERSVAAAKEIGVEAAISGEIPEDPAICAILGRAVRECAVNAVKHAGGTRLNVGLFAAPDGITAVFANDGAPPSGEIRETGGLASLRMTVEASGGSMTVESAPAFRLTVVLPAEKAFSDDN